MNFNQTTMFAWNVLFASMSDFILFYKRFSIVRRLKISYLFMAGFFHIQMLMSAIRTPVTMTVKTTREVTRACAGLALYCTHRTPTLVLVCTYRGEYLTLSDELE